MIGNLVNTVIRHVRNQDTVIGSRIDIDSVHTDTVATYHGALPQRFNNCAGNRRVLYQKCISVGGQCDDFLLGPAIADHEFGNSRQLLAFTCPIGEIAIGQYYFPEHAAVSHDNSHFCNSGRRVSPEALYSVVIAYGIPCGITRSCATHITMLMELASVKLYQGWKVAIAGMGINFLVGISYAWSIFARGLTRELGWSQAETALPYTVFMLCYAGGMVFAGRAQDRLGPRPVVTVGGLLVGGAFIASAFLVRPTVMALVWGVLFGIGLAACFASVTPAAMKWFPPRSRGLIAGVVVTGIGLSAIVMSPLVHLLVQRSVSTAFLVSGVVLLVGTLLLSRWVSNPPHLSEQQLQDLPEEPWHAVLGERRFHLMWLMFLLSTTAGLTFATHLDRIVSAQAAFESGYLVVSLFALFNAIGRPIGGVLSDRLGRTRSMTLTFVFMTAMLLLALAARTVLLLSAVVAMTGLGYGTIFSLFPAATVTFFGERRFGLYYGMVFTAIGIAGVYPLLAGHLFDRLGNFTLALGLPALFCACAALLSLRLSKLISVELDR